MKNKILYGISTTIWFIATLIFMIISFKLGKSGILGVLPIIMMVTLFSIIFIIIFGINIAILIANRAGKDFKKDVIFWLEIVNLILPFASIALGILMYTVVAK